MNKKNITFDLSKSPLIKKDISNNVLFSEFSLLHTCKKQLIIPPINTKKKKSSFLNKTNLNINNDEFNMTIKKILDNLRDKRLQNKKTLYRRKDNEMYKKIKTSLDNNRSLDPSNSQIIMYKPLDDKEQALNKFLVSTTCRDRWLRPGCPSGRLRFLSPGVLPAILSAELF